MGHGHCNWLCCRSLKAVAPAIHVHGFTALEVFEGARRLGMPLTEYLARLKAAGLATLPGTAAEILDDEVRAVICPDKVTTDEWLEVHRVAHSIDNIQCSWVKLGLDGARQALRAGCNDLGGTLMNENISRAAGAEHGQGVEEDDLAAVVAPLGRPLEQRTTLYGRVRTVGRRLAAPPAPPHVTPVSIGARP